MMPFLMLLHPAFLLLLMLLSLTPYIFWFLQKLPSKAVATRKAILRALKLLVIGLFLQGHLQEPQLLDHLYSRY